MIQEYLFTSDEYKSEIEALSIPKKVAKEIESIKNSACYIFKISTSGNREESAKLISPLNDQICEKFEPIVLTNECSAYFNKILFPLANEFERKLRKLLYLASALRGGGGIKKKKKLLPILNLKTWVKFLNYYSQILLL